MERAVPVRDHREPGAGGQTLERLDGARHGREDEGADEGLHERVRVEVGAEFRQEHGDAFPAERREALGVSSQVRARSVVASFRGERGSDVLA